MNFENPLPKDHLLYIAAPYSSPDIREVEARVAEINRCCSILMSRGVHLFSPISHTHGLAIAGGLPRSWAYWCEYDKKMIRLCTHLVILTLPGWEKSVGVTNETIIAQRMNKPVSYLDPITLTH